MKYFSHSRCDKFLYFTCSFSILFLRFRISLHSSSIHPSSILLYQFIRRIVLCSWTFELQIHDRTVDRTAEHTKALSCREMHYCYYRHNPRWFNGTSINTHVRCYITFSVATRFVDWDFLGWLYRTVYTQLSFIVKLVTTRVRCIFCRLFNAMYANQGKFMYYSLYYWLYIHAFKKILDGIIPNFSIYLFM